ncbi:MAG: translation initiation factor IF-2 [Lachnospiraceae bacterium]|nr:translation initiation factor IF-2 [Lachnospiraceae bacterium]
MAKRISSFTKEYDGLENSKVIEILEQNGIAGKKAQSGLSEDEEKIVVKALASMGFKKIDATKENEPSVETEKKTEEAKPKAETVKMEETKPEGKEEAKPEGKEEVKPEGKTETKPEAPKKPGLKKKNIIIVGNEQNRNQQNRNYNGDRRNGGGQYRPQGGNNYSDNRGNNNNNFARPNGPIRPRANMIDRAAEVTNRRLQAEKEEQMKEQALLAAQEQARRESAAREQERQQPSGNENRPQGREDYRNNHGENRYDNRNNQGGYRGGQNRDGQRDGQRPYRGGEGGAPRRDGNGDNRFRKPGQDAQRGFQRPGSKPAGKGFGGDVPMPEEKHRDDEKRRNNIQDKDKKSKKDHLYEEDGEMTLGRGRNSKAGRFIKPVKVKEEKVEDDIKVIVLPDEITIKDLADKMKIQPSAIVKKLFMQGEMVTVNQEISFEKAEEIALEYEIMCEREEKVDVIAELLKEEEEAPENLVERPPVICVMGHVDHGKTSLLDAIRKTHVTDREAGGITQHIGAYTVNVNGKQLTFLDTPGHEAFTSMRMRGANSTDIAILVVAADDGVMPQTVEAINHAKAAGIEIVVAVNKIDKPGANVDRVKQELTEYELISEDWGGTTIFANVSAKTGEGIEELLEMVLLSADVLELKSNPNRQARGLVIEAELDKGRGPVATVLVQKGTLHVGDFISAGASHGKVRAMVDDKGRRVKEAGPSTPVEILGLNDVPNAGEIFICHDNDKLAKNYAETFIAQNKAKLLEDTKAKMSLDDLFSKIQEGNLKELNLIIKADVQGSVEAVKQSLLKLSNEEVVVKVIHGGVGAINESDVILASASEAIIIGFNVRPDAMAKQTAEREGVDVRLYKVIYQAIEDIEAAMKGMLDPVFEEKVIGHAEVRQIFKASAIGNIAGAFVLDGMFQRGCKIRISREGEQIYEGNLASLKRFKDDVKEVKAGFECGLVFEGFEQMQELDIVEAYIMVEVPR